MRRVSRALLWKRVALMTGLAIALSLSASTPATAADNPDNQGGLWYYNAFAVAAANMAGADGSGVKIAVIDSLINTQWPALKGADITIHEPSYCASDTDANTMVAATSTKYSNAHHGTDMTSVIVGNGTGPDGQKGPLGVAPKAHILYYATEYGNSDDPLSADECPAEGVAGDTGDVGHPKAFAAALNQAVADGADIITYAGTVAPITTEVTDAIAAAERAGVVILSARPNSLGLVAGSTDISGLNGLVTVQAMDAAGYIQGASSIADPATDVVGPGVDILGSIPDFSTTGLTSGTSPATNILGGFLADLKSKYPRATGNQLIQSLLRNTGAGQHELTKDPKNLSGYGVASLRQMLKVDPTTYPDVNPLLTTDAGSTPSYQQVTGRTAPPAAAAATSAATAAPSPASSSDGSARSSGGLSGLTTALIIGGILVVLVVVAAIVLVVVLSRRSSRRRPPEDLTRE
jgi:Subtilase family